MCKGINDCLRLTFSCRHGLHFLAVLLVLTGNQILAIRTHASSLGEDWVQRALQQNAPSQTRDEVTTLEIDKPLEGELSGTQAHSYEVTLAEGQYASVVVEQRGIDTLVQLIGEDGKSIVDFDADLRIHGKEKIQLVAELAGGYRLIVKTKYPKLPAGRYEIRLVEVRDATEEDRLLEQARRLQTAAWQLRLADKYPEAFPKAEKALELQERALGPEHPNLAHTLLMLAVISEFKVEYDKAEAFYLRAQRIVESTPESEHQLLARILGHFAWHSFRNRGDYARAATLYDRAIAIMERALGRNHPELARSVAGLGFLYTDQGDYVRAETLLQRALAIYEKGIDEENVLVASTLNRLGLLYSDMGDYFKAESLLQRSLSSFEKKYGPNHGWVAIGLYNLAVLYATMADYDRAEQLYQRAILINEKNNGPNHVSVAGARAHLALLYYSRGDYAKSKELYVSSIPVLEKVLGQSHPLVGFHLGKLAKAYIAVNELTQAESLARRGLSIVESAGGPTVYYLADILHDLARVSAAKDKSAEAVAFQMRANSIIEHNLNVNLAIGSERQKLAYLVTLPEQINRAISLHLRHARNDKTARELAALSILQRKGRIQDALSISLASLRNRSSSEDQAILDQLNAATAQLARFVLKEPQGLSPGEYQKKITTLERQREKLEDEVSRRSLGFFQRSQTISLSTVKAAVPPAAALIEFSVYRSFDPKAHHSRAYSEPHYVAYIIRHQGEVSWVELGRANEIDSDVAALRQALRDPHRKDVQQLARLLDEKVMQPVRAVAGNVTQLLISPDGELNLIPFEALVDEQGRYLVEHYSFAYFTSGRDLLRMQAAREVSNKPMVVANPTFGEPFSERLISAARRNRPQGRRRSVTVARSLSAVYFAPLHGTGREANAIKTLFPDTNLLTETRATEQALKSVTAPRLLHIATHGFFLEDTQTVVAASPRPTQAINANAKIENPLLRSGLALAGANLRGDASGDDGILTALEATGLNLWGTKLVVLSACDTGVGEVRNGEGVYGLRRAFVLAGAESLVMSLWPVSDYSTRILMTNYYKNLKQGMGRGAALRQVQLEMLKRNRQLHPFYWANFIQAGEWANLEGKR